jgi:hypothetical protein
MQGEGASPGKLRFHGAPLHMSAEKKLTMMAAPFATFAVGLALALAGRRAAACVVLLAALALSVGMFIMHATDELPISL